MRLRFSRYFSFTQDLDDYFFRKYRVDCGFSVERGKDGLPAKSTGLTKERVNWLLV